MITFDVDSTEISSTLRQLAMLTGKYEKITAIAMSKAAAAAKQKIASDILPQIEGGPTAWTRRGLRYWRADRDRLVSAAGFNYGDNSPTDLGYIFQQMGTPSGRYMEIQSRGGDRRPKSTELALRRSRLINNNNFIVPAQDSDAVRLDTHGNVSRGEYVRMLSRVRALQVGSAPTQGGKRSNKGRAKNDYFVARGLEGVGITRWELGTKPIYIAKRSGHGPKGGTGKGSGKPGRPQTVGYKRGFDVAFHITQQPRYQSKYNIRGVAWREYNRVFSNEFRKSLAAEMRRR
jgi:hypothetical protein